MPVKPKAHRLIELPPAPSRRESAHRRGYTKRWQKASKLYLAAHPLCRECEREYALKRAVLVDHIVPHRGNYDLFWNSDNWQGLCKRHHDVKTGRGE